MSALWLFSFFFFFYCYGDHRDLHSFPTRRSSDLAAGVGADGDDVAHRLVDGGGGHRRDRKSTRLNSSHEWISYAVFCLKKKKKKNRDDSYKNQQSRMYNDDDDAI